MRLGKASRLRLRREFLAVQDRGRRLPASDYAVLALDNDGRNPRLGVTVSSKVANAVMRNRVKRWVREAFREVGSDLPPVDLVVIARRGAPAAGIDGARLALRQALQALGGEVR
ncbi:MAG: ribonuclease P protein component [Deltaproteobacteria bacterium]|nr:ribonuclease P protein component [Deltaproteobacteria bacterium]